VSVIETLCTFGFTGLLWLMKSVFFGGWLIARWLLWATSFVWAAIAVIGAACGFLTAR
jgi:hypothetical protein